MGRSAIRMVWLGTDDLHHTDIHPSATRADISTTDHQYGIYHFPASSWKYTPRIDCSDNRALSVNPTYPLDCGYPLCNAFECHLVANSDLRKNCNFSLNWRYYLSATIKRRCGRCRILDLSDGNSGSLPEYSDFHYCKHYRDWRESPNTVRSETDSPCKQPA